MLIAVRVEKFINRIGRISYHEFLQMKCDVCGKEWEMQGSKVRVASRKHHTCSKECSKSARQPDGIITRQREKTCIERYGVENTFAASACKDKIKQTLLKRYGVEHALQSPELMIKFKRTMQERWGVEQPMASSELCARQVATMRKNWGVDNTWDIPHVRQALMSGSIAKYGVPYPMQNVEFQKKWFAQRDGISWMSKPEKQFRVLLEEKYGKENVMVQRLVERKWSIDFYVKTIDTWISFDGVYWHGLDRPIEDIRESVKPRDVAIYAKWVKDREFDAYVVSHHLRLVRITDQEFESDPHACILKLEADVCHDFS